jgi:hypothetical protein
LWPAAKALGIDKHDTVNVVLVTSYQWNDGHYTIAQEMEDNYIAPPGTAPAGDDKTAVDTFTERAAQQCLFMRRYVLSPPLMNHGGSATKRGWQRTGIRTS